MKRKPILPLLLLLLAAATACAVAQPNENRLLNRDGTTGTRLRKDLVKGAAYPPNKRYDELTASEREAVKSLYEPMADDDEPPFPRAGMRPFLEEIKYAADKRQASGRLVLVAQVAADGKVAKVDIYATPDDQLARYAAIMLGRTPFKPAVCAGKPCAMEFPFTTLLTREY